MVPHYCLDLLSSVLEGFHTRSAIMKVTLTV